MNEIAIQAQTKYLTIEQWAQAKAIIHKSYSANTLRAYQTKADQWVEWARLHGRRIFPISTEDLAEYLLERTGSGERGVMWAKQSLSMMGLAHRIHEMPSPTEDEKIKLLVRGLKRSGKPPKQAIPFRKDDWDLLRSRLIARQKGEKRPINIRDVAMIGLMRHCLLRQSEVCALNWEDWDGEVICVRRSKTDQEGEGALLFLPKETRHDLKRWKDLMIQPAQGAMFHGVNRMGKILSKRIAHRTVSLALKNAVMRVGMAGDYTGHSCRVGMAMDLVENGHSTTQVSMAGRWSSPQMPGKYARALRAKEGAVAKYCGE